MKRTKKIVVIIICILLLMLINCTQDSAISAWFKENLKDPSSLKVIDWGERKAVKIYGADYKREVTYRAKNSYGGYVIEKTRFFVHSRLSAVIFFEEME